MAKDQRPDDGKGTPEQEEPKQFTFIMSGLANGEANAQCTYQLHKLLREMQEQAHMQQKTVKGEFKLALAIAADESGNVTIRYSTGIKEPEPRTSVAVYWLTRGGNLTAVNPNQATLPGVLREVPILGRGAAREVGGRHLPEKDEGDQT